MNISNISNFIVGLLFTTTLNASAQMLPRTGWFGAQIEVVNKDNYKALKLKEPKGLKIVQTVGGTSKALNLQANDVLLSINNTAFAEIPKLASFISSQKEGQSVDIQIARNGKVQNIQGKVVGRAREEDKNADVIYESVPFRQGKLSVIINKPRKAGKLPAVLFVPGYTCTSVDGLSASHPYGRVVRAYSEAGYVVVRVEKSGLGDSENTPACSSTTLYDEVESFEQGLKKLQSLAYVDTANIFIFGHSMGGVIAPALSAKYPVKGVIVYGTTAKSWFEYQLEMNRLQLMLAKVEPMEYEKRCRIQSEIAYEYFVEKKSLSEIAKNPDKAELLKTDWQYNGKDMIFERNQEYWRQIQDYPLFENWKKTQSKVLVMFGGADFQAFSKADHEQIVYTVNHFHPNHATLAVFPNTDHYLAKSETMQNAFDLFSTGKYQELFDKFDFDVTKKAIDWSNQHLK